MIEIERPADDLTLEVYEEVLRRTPEFARQGVMISPVVRKRFSPQLAEALVIGFASGVLGNYVTHFVDQVFGIAKEKGHHSIIVLLRHEGESFRLPEEREKFRKYFSEMER